MSNLLLICASPRKGGNCASISKYLHTSFNKARVLFLFDYTIKPCIDCKACKNNSEDKDFCSQDNDENNSTKELYKAIYDADTIIFISPIYFYHVPSQLKALIDRAQRYWYNHSSHKIDKKIFAIYAAARPSGQKIPQGVDLSFKYFAPLVHARFMQSLCLYGLEDEQDFNLSQKAQTHLNKYIDYCKNPIFISEKKNFCLSIADFIFQKRCLYCKKSYHDKDYENYAQNTIHNLCPSCASQLKRKTKGYCLTCGTLQDIALENEVLKSCPICEEKPVPWEDLRFYANYDTILKDIIRYAKFHNKFIYTKTLADIILPLIKEIDDFDMLIPIPMHTHKLRERGYNQCHEIAKHLNKTAHIPYESQALFKVKETKPQSSLERKKRLTNLKNAFNADKSKLEGKTILLLDDVSTTGSTLREATKCLLKAGARKVYVIYIAGVKL